VWVYVIDRGWWSVGDRPFGAVVRWEGGGRDLEVKEVVKPKDILAVGWVVLLQKLQQFYFIQTLVEKVFAVFDDLQQR